MLVGIVTALMSTAPIFIAWRSTLSPARCREIILDHRVCPNCYATLPDDPALVSAFDGCAACTHCGRAWRLPPDVS